MEYTLTMVFLTSTGNKQNFSVSGVKSNVSNDEVIAIMDAILASGIFTGTTGDLVSKYDAYVTAKEVTEHEVA